MLREIVKEKDYTILKIISSTFYTNTYIISSGNKVMIVDPGFDKFHAKELEETINFLKSTAPREVIILNTHGHLDHFCGNLKIKGKLAEVGVNVLIAIHKNDAYLLKDFSEHLLIRNIVPEYNLDVFDAQPHDPDLTIQDGDILEIGSLRFRVIHCPGHTKGSVVLYEQDRGILITGDVILDGGIGRVDLPHSNPLDMYRSITRIMAEVKLDSRVLPGHGNVFVLNEQAHYILQEAMLLAQS